MKSLIALALCIVVVAFGALGYCWNAGYLAMGQAPAPAPLQVADTDVIAGVTEGKLSILLNLIRHKPKLEQLSETQATTLITDAALTSAKGQLARAEFASHQHAVVQVLYIPPNEYGANNFAAAVKIGTIQVEKKGEDVSVAGSKLKVPTPR